MVTLRDLDYIIPADQIVFIEEYRNLDFYTIHDGEWIKGHFHSKKYEVIDIQCFKDKKLYIGVKEVQHEE